jgi:glycosyltransferase involved in cell wall biosynthesis
MNEHKRVLFLINGFSIGGGENVFLAQANELWHRGWDVYVAVLFFKGDLFSKLQLPEDRMLEVHARSVFDVGALRRLSHLMRRHRIQTVYSTLNEANTVGRMLKFLNPSVRVFTREANMADIKPLQYKLLDVCIGLCSFRIVAVSYAVARSIATYAPWLGTRMRVLYNGIRVEPAPVKAYEERRSLLTVGSLTPKKDHAVLIDVMALLPKTFTLTVVGNGQLREVLEERVRTLNLKDRVIFLGSIAPEKVLELYRAHDIFVLPSKREGCPNVVSEAQSHSLPIVAFDIPGMREFVDDECGAVVPHRDAGELAKAIEGLGSNAAVMRSKGEAGYRKVSREREFTMQIEKLIALLSE